MPSDPLIDLILRLRSELKAVKEENERLRVEWGLLYTGGLGYFEDGECIDTEDYPYIDWKRMSIEEIKQCMITIAERQALDEQE